MAQDHTGRASRGMASVSGAQTARVLRPGFSPLFLPEDGGLRRLPRAPARRRPQAFMDRFEDRALFYDCFWHDDGARVLLIGPPPLNLQPEYDAARFTALPSGTPLQAAYYPWRSTLLSELTGVPPGTTHVQIAIAGLGARLQIQPNLAGSFNGTRLVFTMNKDNELGWIRDWADYHARVHGADCVVVFDNGSSHYGLDQIAETLGAVSGLRHVVLCDWPYRFGANDRAVLMHRFWAHFLQISAMNVAMRRFGAAAHAVLNCDIDELVGAMPGGTVFDAAVAAPDGLIHLDGTWIDSARAPETGTPPYSHFDYCHVRRVGLSRLSPGKWALDPKRAWARELSIVPSWHRVQNAPDNIEKNQPHGRLWHFAGINTNWKSQRRQMKSPHRLTHRLDPGLAADRDLYRHLVEKAPE